MGQRPGWMPLVSKILLCGLLIYLGLGGLALLSQKSLTYHPQPARPEDEAFLDSYPWLHKVQFHAADGIELHAVWAPPAGGQAVLLFSHGNAGNLLGRIPLVERLHKQGVITREATSGWPSVATLKASVTFAIATEPTNALSTVL